MCRDYTLETSGLAVNDQRDLNERFEVIYIGEIELSLGFLIRHD